MAKVAVNPEIIRWALQRSDMTEAILKKFPKLNSWLQNESQPTLKQLEKLAKATSTPLGFFFLSQPPQLKLPIPHYRTLDDTFVSEPSPDLLETVQMMQRRQAWMREYLLDMGQAPLPFVGSCTITVDPKEVATKIRKTLGLENGWAAVCRTWQEALQLLMVKVEDLGILVIRNGIVGNNTRRKLNVHEFRGFVLVDEYAPLIFINGADGKAAQMFTLAHELAHIWYGASAAFDLSNLQPSNIAIEQACNLTSAEFLVPEEELKTEWKSIKHNPDRFNLLAKHFKVSSIVAARRALDIGLINKKEFFDFYHEWQQLERKSDQDGGSRGNYYANQHFRIGRRFAEAVFASVRAGRLTYLDAYRLTDLRGSTFSNYAKHLGIEV